MENIFLGFIAQFVFSLYTLFIGFVNGFYDNIFHYFPLSIPF